MLPRAVGHRPDCQMSVFWLPVEQQAWMRWCAADLHGDDCVHFGEIVAVDQFVGADYLPLCTIASLLITRPESIILNKFTHQLHYSICRFLNKQKTLQHIREGERKRNRNRNRHTTTQNHTEPCHIRSHTTMAVLGWWSDLLDYFR